MCVFVFLRWNQTLKSGSIRLSFLRLSKTSALPRCEIFPTPLCCLQKFCTKGMQVAVLGNVKYIYVTGRDQVTWLEAECIPVFHTQLKKVSGRY